LINAQAAEFLGSLVYVSFEDLFGKHTAPDADADEDRNRARIEVEGVPISVALDGDTIEIVIERQLEKDHAFRLAENLRARIEAATRRPCILTQS
jgi:hypothetical protein